LRLPTRVYHSPGQVKGDLKDYLQHETISRLYVAVTGTINQNGAASSAGAATGWRGTPRRSPS